MSAAHLVVVIEVLVAEREPMDARCQQPIEPVHRDGRIAQIAKAARHLLRQPDGQIGLAQPRRPPVEVTAPPSNAPTTRRPSNPSNANCVALHSASIGRAFIVSRSVCLHNYFR
jgi:hypothetical protein